MIKLKNKKVNIQKMAFVEIEPEIKVSKSRKPNSLVKRKNNNNNLNSTLKKLKKQKYVDSSSTGSFSSSEDYSSEDTSSEVLHHYSKSSDGETSSKETKCKYKLIFVAGVNIVQGLDKEKIFESNENNNFSLKGKKSIILENIEQNGLLVEKTHLKVINKPLYNTIKRLFQELKGILPKPYKKDTTFLDDLLNKPEYLDFNNTKSKKSITWLWKRMKTNMKGHIFTNPKPKLKKNGYTVFLSDFYNLENRENSFCILDEDIKKEIFQIIQSCRSELGKKDTYINSATHTKNSILMSDVWQEMKKDPDRLNSNF